MLDNKEKWDAAWSSDKQDISYNDIEALFDSERWHCGVITKEQLLQVSLMPIKHNAHPFGANFTNDIHFDGLCNTLILAQPGHMWDYTHYNQAVEVMMNSKFDRWFPIYTNFKEAALRAGIGVRARNSLIYNYRFGFDIHFTAIGFVDNIVDLPTDRRHNKKIWNRCIGCDDCMIQCPVKAIRNKEDPMWLNSMDCDGMISFGIPERPDIPSIKTFWHKNLYPEIPQEEIDKVVDYPSLYKLLGTDSGSFPWGRNGYEFDGQVIRDKNGDSVNVPFCRECTSQPRCSKWGGKFPYDRLEGRIKDIIASDAPSASLEEKEE